LKKTKPEEGTDIWRDASLKSQSVKPEGEQGFTGQKGGFSHWGGGSPAGKNLAGKDNQQKRTVSGLSVIQLWGGPFVAGTPAWNTILERKRGLRKIAAAS